MWNKTLKTICAAMSLTASALGAELTFYCPFDAAPDAQFASGLKDAIFRTAAFVPGKKGQALYVPDADQAICFDSSGNLPKDRGTIELWVKGDWEGNNEDWQGFVWEEAEGEGDGSIWFWKYKGNIRFDIRCRGDANIAAPIQSWARGEWHHIAATYDCAAGAKLYIDGKLAASREFKWEPRSHEAFYVGSRYDGRYPAEAAFDELKIYNAPLSDAEIALACEGKLEAAFAGRPRVIGEAAPPDAAPPKLIFHLPFEDKLDAATAAGQGQAKISEGIRFTDGIVGRAAEFGKESKLVYAEQGNLEKNCGSICFWYRPDFKPERDARHCMFRENGPNEKGENAMWFWFWGLGVRFDLRDAGDNFVVRNVPEWEPGKWHFLAVTWDSQRERRVYVDGEYVRERGDNKKGFGLFRWDTKPYEEFFIGADERGDVADGAIDEFKIYDGPLSADQIAREYFRRFPVSLNMRHIYFLLGKGSSFSWNLKNDSDAEARGAVSWRLTDADETLLAGGDDRQMSLGPEQEETISAEITPAVAGELRLTCSWKNADGGFRYERQFSCWVVPEDKPRRGGELKLKPIREIDCTQAPGEEEFVDGGQSKIVETSFGKYREAGSERHSRFAYRILTPKVGAPHLLAWDYPDDKARTMDVILQTTGKSSGMYDMQTGVFCGAEYPLSNQFLTHKAVFWPRQEDQALIFMTAENDRPAAVSKIRLYEIEGRLPALPVNAAAPRNGWERMVGLYYEDPVLASNFGGEQTMPGFAGVVDRLLDYMDYFGQNVLMYPGVWYRGPFFPSRAETRVDNQHGRPHPFNYIEYLCLRMGQRGVHFIPTFNVHSLPSLAENALFDQRQIQAGKETVLMMMWNNRPKTIGWHGTPPNFNPISPEAQGQFLKMIDEMLELYGDLPAFKGICFHLTQHSILWFGSLDAGYNDCNIERFQQESGIRIPVDAKDPLRFNKRYRWLMANAQEQWVEWRCRKIGDYYTEIARRLTRKRPDLRLVLNIYIPSSPDEKLEMLRSTQPEAMFQEIARRAGLDPSMFIDQPGIVIQRTLFPADYRWARAHRPITPETEISRQINFLDAGFAPLRKCRQVWINYHDRYWEDDIGRRNPLKGLWGGELGWRVSTLNPNLNHCMEFHAWALASVDSLSFTKGGFVVGTIGMERKLGEFAQSFRSLPAVRFDDVPGLFDPVSVRQFRDGERLCFYLVNRLSCPVEVRLDMTGMPGQLSNLRTGKIYEYMPINDTIHWSLTMGPYALESFAADSKDLQIRGGHVQVPEEWAEGLKQRLHELEEKAAHFEPDPANPALRGVDFKTYFTGAHRMLEEGRYGQLHFLLEDSRAKTLDQAK